LFLSINFEDFKDQASEISFEMKKNSRIVIFENLNRKNAFATNLNSVAIFNVGDGAGK
jgi:hypothetical protein